MDGAAATEAGVSELSGFEADEMDEGHLLAVRIIEWLDRGRIDRSGGYPSQYGFLCDLIIRATVEEDRTNKPVLAIQRVSDFLEEWRDVVHGFDDDGRELAWGAPNASS